MHIITVFDGCKELNPNMKNNFVSAWMPVGMYPGFIMPQPFEYAFFALVYGIEPCNPCEPFKALFKITNIHILLAAVLYQKVIETGCRLFY